MSFIDSTELEQLKTKITDDLSLLGKLYKAKKSDHYIRNVDHNLAEKMIKEGWEEIGQLKTKKVSETKKFDVHVHHLKCYKLHNFIFIHINHIDVFCIL